MPDNNAVQSTYGGSSGSGSKHFAATTPAVIFATALPLWYSFVQMKRLIGLFVTKGVPVECLETSPPTAQCINQVFPWLILSITTIMTIYTIKTFFIDKHSQQVLDVIEREFDKRHEVVRDLLGELKDEFVIKGDDNEIELFNSKVVWERLDPLLELPNYDKETAEEGFRWLWIVLAKELRVSLKLTKEGKDVKFSSGEQLQKCVNDFEEKVTRSRLHGFGPKCDERKLLYKLKREAIYYLRIHGLKTVVKAAKMALLAKEAFPWLLLQAACTTVTAMLLPLKLHYRAQVMENISDVEGYVFWEAAKAMLLFELLSNSICLVTKMIKMHAGTLANKEIKIAYYSALLKMPITFWSRQTTCSGSDRVGFYNVKMFGREVTNFLEIPQNLLRDLVKALTYAYMVLRTSSRSLVLLICANAGSILMSWVLHKITTQLSALSMNGVIKTAFSDEISCWYSLRPEYIATYLSFVRGPAEIKRFVNIEASSSERVKRQNLVEAFSGPLSSVVSNGSDIAQFSTARTNVIDQGISVTDVDTMVRSAENFVKNAQSVGGIFGKVVRKAKPLAQAYDIISLPKDIDPDIGLWPERKAKGHIEFKDVRFKYPRRDAEVLKGVTFEVNPGDTIGMTGPAGSGKSSCLRLLERFYDVSSGRILLDGIDIRKYNPRWLRGQIASVAQEPKLVPLTLRENLTFGCNKEPSLEEIYDALRAANIYDSIMDKDKFPQGLRTEIESAGNVSGGEKQRIAIARAILANRPILLLDEATSALDEDNQEKVQEALNNLMKGRTTLVIAHRLSTIKNSSKIIGFDKGKVVEEGKHQDLIVNERSLYRNLWIKQTSMPVEDGVEDGEYEEAKISKPVEADHGVIPKPGLTRLETLVQ